MPDRLQVAILGDFDPTSPVHAATGRALAHAGASLGCDVRPEWVPTQELSGGVRGRLDRAHAILAAPGSPYRSMTGALEGIRFAREARRPFLGT